MFQSKNTFLNIVAAAGLTVAVAAIGAVYAGGMYLLTCCGAAAEAPEQVKCQIIQRC